MSVRYTAIVNHSSSACPCPLWLMIWYLYYCYCFWGHTCFLSSPHSSFLIQKNSQRLSFYCYLWLLSDPLTNSDASSPVQQRPTSKGGKEQGHLLLHPFMALFKKFDGREDISSSSAVKSSVIRGIRSTLLKQYPKIESILNELLPPKGGTITIAKCSGKIQLICRDGFVLFFQERVSSLVITNTTYYIVFVRGEF